jgi:hypothetical protein
MLNWRKKKQPPPHPDSLDSQSGSGTIYCNDCGHSEEVISFLHGFGPKSQCTLGYQCQSCAKLVDFDSKPIGGLGMKLLEIKVRTMRCECGGRYARDKQIKCPQCKSVDVRYELGMIT